METLLELAERCEREHPGVALDDDIWTATTGLDPFVETPAFNSGNPPNRKRMTIPHYTTSLDAAVTLVPSEAESWLVAKGRVTPDEPIWGAGVYSDEGAEHEIGAAETNASAAACLCAAALRARAAIAKARRRT